MKYLIYITIVSLLSSCQRGCAKLDRGFQTGTREYEVIMYSGGDTVFHDHFKGIINNSEHSDGCYYYKGDTLVEVSGDYIIKSIK